ncbi:MAG TPA: dTMP kinase [Vicinamibacterales bacterium]|jgi:dTMP kinase|nr:dTMP kinase [Vicinamibacterales bacterium]
MRGLLIVFEGLDQSGKQTQAEALRDALVAGGRGCELLSFPDYETPIGGEIGAALQGRRDYPPDVMQLLYIANRFEKKPQVETALGAGTIVVCDRYLASSIAYGEAQGLDPAWLAEIQRLLPQPDLTILLDIVPETAAGRKAANRDRYERDLALLGRVRNSYLRQAAREQWLRLDGARDRSLVSADVIAAVTSLL